MKIRGRGLRTISWVPQEGQHLEFWRWIFEDRVTKEPYETTKIAGDSWRPDRARSQVTPIEVPQWYGMVWVCIYIYLIPLTISTTKRVNTCLVPSSDSWIIQAKKVDPCTSFCSKRVCTVSCSGVPFYTHKSETHFVVIYFGMRCVVPETL